MLSSLLITVITALSAPAEAAETCPEVLSYEVRNLNGKESVRLCDAYRGKVLLVVNTASKCAFTPQYEGLEYLYDTYNKRGLVVLGFPSDDFGGQEPGGEAQIQQFCRLAYSVRFPMFEKLHAGRGAAQHPLYRHLAGATGVHPGWNFHKYVIDRQGRVAASLASQVAPRDPELVGLIESLLGTEG
ncbi:glutathione peroxidase [Thioalbus denitrificans]|uniref:Glutathione peroxidase n=1 Tax=Thioalbus denitrificans TaxID=547122 RepID=A0A369CGI4_9GAMM|nr:glutathione peroxidase [Thioalbus denitrificans]RCX33170.1 glutathione peroxidase [Thioalbus denitrificans]